jgi:hypothetical protein
MQQGGKRLKKKELSDKLLWNEELAASHFGGTLREEKAIAQV